MARSAVPRSRARTLISAVTRVLPPRLVARLDHLRREPREPWGGAFNGQRHRQAIVAELAEALRFDEVVETGTFRGTTTEFLADTVGVPLKTVEFQPRYYHYSRRRLRKRDVELALGDSRSFLRELASREGASSERVLFYLDAHWEEDLPLGEEMLIIAAHSVASSEETGLRRGSIVLASPALAGAVRGCSTLVEAG